LVLKSGKKEGEPVRGVYSKDGNLPRTMNDGDVFNELKTGNPNSEDNAYVYFYPRSTTIYYRGTIPPAEDSFKISAAINSPGWYFYHEFNNKRKFEIDGDVARNYGDFESLQKYSGNKKFIIKHYGLDSLGADDISKYDPYIKPFKILRYLTSPTLDSIIYWFLKKSINLYGEALVKTFAYEKQGFGSTDSGVAIVKDFWKQKGIDENELNIYDGSGLSPLNRVTTHSQVEILKYAKTKDWFPYFYDALPEYNGMKMKSGTINDVKAFCGYQTAKDGKEYIFSFIVNNFNGRSSELVSKMYKVLDNLK
jgi:D-alanyl-D-alanine carboxypeptidase/D-alanyl-D-alanine-endopeptidase (penicillin-binding protein 4)